jgi:hypothetical protein
MAPLFKWTGENLEYTLEAQTEQNKTPQSEKASLFAGAKKVEHNKILNVDPPKSPKTLPKKRKIEDVATTTTFRPLVRKLNFMNVPPGASSGDQLCMLDVKNKVLTDIRFSVPWNAFAGMQMSFASPPQHMKILLVDHIGYKVGGNLMHQHAVRLETHRKHCCCECCQVAGCHGESMYELFVDKPEEGEVEQYASYWEIGQRSAQKARGLSDLDA